MESATGARGNARAEWLTTSRDQAKILEGYLVKAEQLFIERARAAGLVLTGEMVGSFRKFAAEQGAGYVEARIEMAGYFRIKDLRSMSYKRTPPLEAMVAYVEAVGVNKFAFIPGYPTGIRPASETAAINRVAWSLKMSRQRTPNIKRGYRGIYSDPLLSDLLPYLFRDLTEQTNLTALRGVKLLFND